MSQGDSADNDGRTAAVVLDFLPHGRADDDRPRYQKSPIAYAVGDHDFGLYELVLESDADINIGDRVVLEPREERRGISKTQSISYSDLSGGAQSEIDYAVAEIIDADEQRFVDFYNDAQPITLRLHQLNLLPGIGKKLRNNILDERKRGPFEGFDDLEERVSGLHKPKEVLVERILEEIRDTDLKYRIFAE